MSLDFLFSGEPPKVGLSPGDNVIVAYSDATEKLNVYRFKDNSIDFASSFKHKSTIECVCISPSRELLVVCDSEKSIDFYRFKDFKLLFNHIFSGVPKKITITDDSKYCYVALGDCTIHVINLYTGHLNSLVYSFKPLINYSFDVSDIIVEPLENILILFYSYSGHIFYNINDNKSVVIFDLKDATIKFIGKLNDSKLNESKFKEKINKLSSKPDTSFYDKPDTPFFLEDGKKMSVKFHMQFGLLITWDQDNVCHLKCDIWRPKLVVWPCPGVEFPKFAHNGSNWRAMPDEFREIAMTFMLCCMRHRRNVDGGIAVNHPEGVLDMLPRDMICEILVALS